MLGLGLASSKASSKTRFRGIKALKLLLLIFILKIQLSSFQQVEIHWDIVCVEILGWKSLAHLLKLLHILGKCIQV